MGTVDASFLYLPQATFSMLREASAPIYLVYSVCIISLH